MGAGKSQQHDVVGGAAVVAAAVAVVAKEVAAVLKKAAAMHRAGSMKIGLVGGFVSSL